MVLHLLCLSISVYLRPSTQNHATIKRLHDQESANMNQAPTVDQEEDDFIEETDVNRIIRYCSEVATIIGVLSYVIFQQGDEVKNQGLVAFLKQLVMFLPKIFKCITIFQLIYVLESRASKSYILGIKFINFGMHSLSNHG